MRFKLFLRDLRKIIKNWIYQILFLIDCNVLIDCDADPFVPEGLTVVEHNKGGMYRFDSKKVALYRSEGQKKRRIIGTDLKEELTDKSVLNANVLDNLLAKPWRIPRIWIGKDIDFWGTTYSHPKYGLCIRRLSYDYYRFKWKWFYHYLDSDFCYNELAILKA